MKRILFFLICMGAVTGMSLPAIVQADPHGPHGGPHGFAHGDFDHWSHGHWYHGWHDARGGWWWIVNGFWYWYPAMVYPYPDPYTPPVVVQTPGTVIQTAPVVVQTAPAQPAAAVPVQPQSAPAVWYYCDRSGSYYPYVAECPSGWRAVPSTPPGVSTNDAPPPPRR